MIDKKLLINDIKAASPVIGVMLMVVVTVILAAAVSAYSSGLMTDTSVAPTASFDVEMRKDVKTAYGNMSYITIREVSGDSIPTKDLKIITINPNAEGNNKTREILPNVNNTNTYFVGTAPWWNRGNFISYDCGQNFGEFILEPGMTMLADEYENYDKLVSNSWDPVIGTYSNDGNVEYAGTSAMQAMFADWGDDPGDPRDDTIHSGDVVTIKIVHTPSNKVIFQKDVVVL